MNCPLQSEENLDLLLDYSAGRLDGTRSALLRRHMDTCAGCAAFRVEQTALWKALDVWEPEPVSMSFNRRLWQKIDDAAAAPWHRKLADGLRFGAWKPAFPLAAAALLIAAGFMFDHRSPLISPGHGSASASGVSVSDAEQLEKALDDIQLLRQFDAATVPASGTSNAM